jgi:hypothetical protein
MLIRAAGASLKSKFCGRSSMKFTQRNTFGSSENPACPLHKLNSYPMKNVLFTVLLFLVSLLQVNGQVISDKVVGKKNQEKIDSIKSSEYPYMLPIWGAKVAARGFNLPLPMGVSVNTMWQESDLIIDNLYVGFNNGPQYNLDEVVRFDEAVSSASSIIIRPDFWVLPFLNVYGIFAKAKTSTAITAGVWVPVDESNWERVATFSTKAEFDATSTGFGMTPTMGVAGGWVALDMNVAWTDVSALDKPVFSFVFGPRMGKNFNLKKKDSAIAFWVGAFRLKMASSTSGSLYLDELIPGDELQGKVDAGIEKVGDAQESVDEWWSGLSGSEQNNPINQAKYETANQALDKTANILNSIDVALNDDERASVQYSLEKKPKDMWNMVVGTQFQLNKHFMIRGEYGFLGTRNQFTGGLQYRFGL